MLARPRLWFWAAGLMLAIAGCKNSRPAVEPFDYSEPAPVSSLPPPEPPTGDLNLAATSTPLPEPPSQELTLASYQEKEKPPEKPRPGLEERLKLPPGLPGANAPMIDLRGKKEAERRQIIDRYFPALPPAEDVPPGALGPGDKPLTLADLQRLARANSPTVRQAAAAVDAARGVAIQVGLWPNPRVGYEGDSIGQGNGNGPRTAGIQGGFVEQTVITVHKRKLAREAAEVDVKNAELALRRAEIDLTTAVRRGYFSVLTARRALEVGRAYVALTSVVYAIQVGRLRGGFAAVYEVHQARVLATQARATLLQARNRYLAEWRRLAAALGLPKMPLTELAGDVDLPVPRFHQDDVLPIVLTRHTDVLTAANSITRAQVALRAAEVQPFPDVDLRYMAQKDNTTLPFGVVHSVLVGVQIPVFNHNQGAIAEAQANLGRAGEEPARVRNDLTSQVATAFQRYDTARALVLVYRDQVLPDQVRAYRGIYQRYDKGEGEKEAVVNFNDIITSQQTLADALRSYLDALGDLWDSVVDIANLLQLDDLHGDGVCPPSEHDICPVPQLAPLQTKPRSEETAPMPRAAPEATKQQPAPALRRVSPVPAATPAPSSQARSQAPEEGASSKVPFAVWQLKENRRAGFRACTS